MLSCDVMELFSMSGRCSFDVRACRPPNLKMSRYPINGIAGIASRTGRNNWLSRLTLRHTCGLWNEELSRFPVDGCASVVF